MRSLGLFFVFLFLLSPTVGKREIAESKDERLLHVDKDPESPPVDPNLLDHEDEILDDQYYADLYDFGPYRTRSLQYYTDRYVQKEVEEVPQRHEPPADHMQTLQISASALENSDPDSSGCQKHGKSCNEACCNRLAYFKVADVEKKVGDPWQEIQNIASKITPQFHLLLDRVSWVVNRLKELDDPSKVKGRNDLLEVLKAPLKGKKSSMRKATDKYGAEFCRMKDLIRATLVAKDVKSIVTIWNIFKDPEELSKVLNDEVYKNISLTGFPKVQAKVEVTEMKNTFNPKRTLAYGYRDAKVYFLLRLGPSALMAELQTTHSGLLRVKDFLGHEYYDVIRVVKPIQKKVVPLAGSGSQNRKEIQEIHKEYKEKILEPLDTIYTALRKVLKHSKEDSIEQARAKRYETVRNFQYYGALNEDVFDDAVEAVEEAMEATKKDDETLQEKHLERLSDLATIKESKLSKDLDTQKFLADWRDQKIERPWQKFESLAKDQKIETLWALARTLEANSVAGFFDDDDDEEEEEEEDEELEKRQKELEERKRKFELIREERKKDHEGEEIEKLYRGLGEDRLSTLETHVAKLKEVSVWVQIQFFAKLENSKWCQQKSIFSSAWSANNNVISVMNTDDHEAYKDATAEWEAITGDKWLGVKGAANKIAAMKQEVAQQNCEEEVTNKFKIMDESLVTISRMLYDNVWKKAREGEIEDEDASRRSVEDAQRLEQEDGFKKTQCELA